MVHGVIREAKIFVNFLENLASKLAYENKGLNSLSLVLDEHFISISRHKNLQNILQK